MPGGLDSWLYHDVADGGAQGINDVKKLSKAIESAADQRQMKRTSTKVYASFADVRHNPRGRPRYSS